MIKLIRYFVYRIKRLLIQKKNKDNDEIYPMF